MFFMSHVVVKVSHLSAAPQSRWHIFRLVGVRHVTCGCQGVSPFGSPQSRWHIFRLVRVRHVTCGCQGVSPFGSPPVKMAHLSTGSCSSCHMWLSRCLTFRQPPQSRWHIFRLVRVRHVTCGCQGVSPFGSPPSQDGTSFDWFVFVDMSHVVVKVSHLSAAPSQDGTSFDWFVFVMSHVVVKVSHLSAAPSH